MKSADLSKICQAHMRYLTAHEVPMSDFSALSDMARLLDKFSDSTVAALSKRIRAIGSTVTLEGSLTPHISELASMERLHGDVGSKAVVKEINVLRSALAAHQNIAFEALLIAAQSNPAKAPGSKRRPTATVVRSDVVARYVRLLDQALGDNAGFATIFDELEQDETISNSELSTIAKRFAFTNARSRKAALDKIQGRQNAMNMSRAKSAATAGRIAG